MSNVLTAVYQGKGILRLLEAPDGLESGEQVQVLVMPFVVPEASLRPTDLPLTERIQAVYDDMGLVEIQDPEIARQIAEDDSLLEWNLHL